MNPKEKKRLEYCALGKRLEILRYEIGEIIIANNGIPLDNSEIMWRKHEMEVIMDKLEKLEDELV